MERGARGVGLKSRRSEEEDRWEEESTMALGVPGGYSTTQLIPRLEFGVCFNLYILHSCLLFEQASPCLKSFDKYLSFIRIFGSCLNTLLVDPISLQLLKYIVSINITLQFIIDHVTVVIYKYLCQPES